ncbi:MAG TPA: DUF1684 domain-containing protein [Pyrinomonadaceae bacterium]|nr:DUF1684 domain-containing protein [Pyrinomonadaceae bacterium]
MKKNEQGSATGRRAAGLRSRLAFVKLLPACVALALSVACGAGASREESGAHAAEVEQWKAKRLASLTSEDGWLTLTGLHWLKEGENRFGSDASNDIRLPEGKAPGQAGSLFLSGGAVRLEARPDVELTHEGGPVSSLDLRSDADGQPTVLKLGTLSLQVIKRGERLALRVKDSQHPARVNFKGLEYFPFTDRWRVNARFERYDPPRPVPIANVIGTQEDQPSPGAVVFEAGGRTHRLDVLTEQGEEQFFIIFADQTSGKETYGAGRYLYAGPPDKQGRIVVDFNRAYSPPCAFTQFATCPLPPPQNRLALRVEAGEKFVGH